MNIESRQSLSDIEYYSLIRSQIEHEDNLIGQRLSWFVASQSFFFTAYAIVVSNFRLGVAAHHQQILLYHIIPLAGAVTCTLLYCTTLGGHFAIRNLSRIYEQKSEGRPGGLPPVHGMRRTQFLGEAAPLFLPPIFLCLWVVILLSNRA